MPTSMELGEIPPGLVHPLRTMDAQRIIIFVGKDP